MAGADDDVGKRLELGKKLLDALFQHDGSFERMFTGLTLDTRRDLPRSSLNMLMQEANDNEVRFLISNLSVPQLNGVFFSLASREESAHHLRLSLEVMHEICSLVSEDDSPETLIIKDALMMAAVPNNSAGIEVLCDFIDAHNIPIDFREVFNVIRVQREGTAEEQWGHLDRSIFERLSQSRDTQETRQALEAYSQDLITDADAAFYYARKVMQTPHAQLERAAFDIMADPDRLSEARIVYTDYQLAREQDGHTQGGDNSDAPSSGLNQQKRPRQEPDGGREGRK